MLCLSGSQLCDKLLSPQGVCRQHGATAEAGKGSTAYSLHAVVCHTGNLLGGHYIGYVRCVTLSMAAAAAKQLDRRDMCAA